MIDTTNPKTEAAAIIEAVTALHHIDDIDYTDPDTGNTMSLVFAPKGMARYEVPLAEREELNGGPFRRKGNTAVKSIAAFCDLVTRHISPAVVVYADDNDQRPSLTAVINDHDPSVEGSAGFRDHRITYAPALSAEWRTWNEMNGKWMSQAQFAQFLEDHILDLTDGSNVGPTTQKTIDALGVQVASPLVLRSLARDMNVRVKMAVREARNLSSGETQVVYATENTTEDGRPLVVPGAFMIAIPVYENTDLYAIAARLRYRIVEGSGIAWSFQLTHPERARRSLMATMIDTVRSKTGALVVEGIA